MRIAKNDGRTILVACKRKRIGPSCELFRPRIVSPAMREEPEVASPPSLMTQEEEHNESTRPNPE